MVTLNLWSWLDFTTTICDRLKVFFTPFLPHSYFVTGQEIITVFYLLAYHIANKGYGTRDYEKQIFALSV